MASSQSYALPLHFLSIGDGILVYWDGDRKWYPAEITGAEGDHRCEILYEDGEREWISLDKVKYIVKRGRHGSTRGKGKRAKSDAEKSEARIEDIKDILFDIEDRLPLRGVFAENPEWWKAWHDEVVVVVAENNIGRLMDATLRLALQLKPNITSEWWSKHSDGWRKCLESAVTIWDATQVVEDLRDNAISWSVARNLFSEKEVDGAFKDGFSQDKAKGLNVVNNPRSNESWAAGLCLDVEVPSSIPQECLNPSVKDDFSKQDSTVQLCTDYGASKSHEKTTDGKKVQWVACRRSNRLKRKSTVEELSPQSSTRKLKSMDDFDGPPCSAVPLVSCSREAEIREILISAHSPLVKANRKQHANKDALNHHGSSKQANMPHPKEGEKFVSSVMEHIDEGFKDEPLNERSSDDSRETCMDRVPHRVLCSVCQTGVASNYFVQCKDSGCFFTFHIFCLSPPLQIVEKDWLCPYCDGDLSSSMLTKDRKLIPKKIQKIVGRKQVILEDQKSAFQDLFLIKWQSFSHHHDSWVPREWLYLVDRIRLLSYLRKCPTMNESDPIDERKPEWFKIDRVIACRKKFNLDKTCEIWSVCPESKIDGEYEFLVKWMGLDYCDSTWESSCTEELLAEIGRLVQRHQRASEITGDRSVSSGNESVCMAANDLYGGILYDYQLQGLTWILSNFKAGRNVILADEMGLGKTVQVVSFVKCMKQEKLNVNPVLIIAPKSILFQWEKEFGHWAGDLNVIIYQGEKQSRRCIQAHELYSSEKNVLFDALVTNYELIILDSSILKKFKWSAIVIDEAHKIKRLDCKLASYLKRYHSDFRLLLTGTPLQNTLLELFALLHFIDPERFSDPVAEADSYSSIRSGTICADVESKIAEIHALLKPRMLRRMKSDVLPGSIPVKKWVEVPCALTDCQRELYINILEKNYEKLNKEIHSGKKIILNNILMELRKCCNHPYLIRGQEPPLSSKEATFRSLVAASGKLQLLEKLLPKLKERGNRVLLFSQMTAMLDILEDFLMLLGLSYFRIDGSTPLAARQQRIKDYNDPGSRVFIFLISTRAGGLGIDLPTADRVILYDPDFNPFMDLQAQSRAHRIGQTRPVVVYQLITKCSVEVKILQKSKQKLAVENLVMNPSKKPNVDDLHSVLLHGARTILNRKKVKETSIHYNDEAIETLLKLDPAPGENCSPDDNGYLGSIQSFDPEATENEGPPSSPKVEEWKNVLGPVQAGAGAKKVGDFGKGKRQKNMVNYECEDESDSDEIYTPEVSSSGDNSSDDDSEPEVADDALSS